LTGEAQGSILQLGEWCPERELEEDVVAERAETRVDDVDESREVSPYRYEITAYGADYPVDGLVKRLREGDIVIPTLDPEEPSLTEDITGFQRGFIWTKTQCNRFVESLLLGLPVPGIFLVKMDDRRFLVLDGQQRLRTLHAFYKGLLRGKAFALEEVQKEYTGLTYDALAAGDRRRLDDSIIHATIVRQDEPPDDLSSVYLLFERLNSGGTNLQPQEIRVALYHGALTELVRELNEDASWREIYGSRAKRLKDQELILRFFALRYWADRYGQPMKDFLNQYANANRDLQLQSGSELRDVFGRTTALISAALGATAFRLKNAINAAILDSVMVAVAELAAGPAHVQPAKLRRQYESLLDDEEFRGAVGKSTANEEQVKTRLLRARTILAKAH